MKQFLFCLLALLTTIACTNPNDNGGSTDNPEPDKPKAELTLNVSSVDFAAEGGEREVSFVSSEVWSAEILNDRADGWCSVTPTSGDAGEATIRITATANKTTDDRSASVIIKAGKLSKTVKVNQKQMDALTVTSSKFEVGCIGGEIQIEVKANIDFQYAIEESAKGWITYRQTRALKSSTLIFAVVENSNVEKREAKIYITHGELTEVVTIYQEGSKPTIVISKSEYVLSAGSETIAVEVKSNVDVAVELPADVNWIRESKSRATSTNTYYFEISANEQYDPRYAEIKFINKENNLSEVVKITQSQKDAIVIARDSYTISSDGGDIQVEVGHNVELDINIDCDWITRVENTRAYQSEKLIFSVAPYSEKDDRSATITIASHDGKISQSITVVQTGYKAFDPSIDHWGDGGENGGVTD